MATRLDEEYEVEKKQLGEGSYGSVAKGRHRKSGMIRAIKAIDHKKSSKADEERLKKEVDIHKSLDHPNIVKLYEVFKDAKKYYLVMELCTGGELFDRIVEEAEKHDDGTAFDERGAAVYMKQILGAMMYMHTSNCVHRDIKPENFLLSNKTPEAEIKVIDFGLAHRFEKGKSDPMKTKAGTPYYVAPEVLRGSYDEKCDVWSCGVILYILICGFPPFFGDNDNEILRRVKKAEYDFPSPEWDNISAPCKDMVRQMLTFDIATRPSTEVLLRHSWMTGFDDTSKPPPPLPVNFSKNITSFKHQSKLKKVGLAVIAQQVEQDSLQALKSVWTMMDDNKDGTLTIAEAMSGMEKINTKIAPADLEVILKSLDTDGSGKIDYTEFIAATMDVQGYNKESILWQAFRVFDKDQDGVITKEELKEVLKTDDVVAAAMKEADLDGDGTISFDEFCKTMTG